MAIRKRPDRAKPYQVYWNNPITGKRESKSFEKIGDARKHDSLIAHRLEHERESFMPEDYTPESESSGITFDALYWTYLRYKKFSKDNAAKQIDNMRQFLSAFGQLPVSEITRQHIFAIMDSMRESGCKQATVYTRTSHLRAVFNWGANQDLIANNPISGVKIERGNLAKIPPPSPEEAGRIFAACSPHIQRVIVLGTSMGIRIGQSELFKLRWESFDLARGYVRIWSAAKNPDRPWRDVAIKSSLIPLITQWAAEDSAMGYEYVVNFRGQPVGSIKTAWRTALKKAGITRRIRPYDLRHSFATEALAAGADIKSVADIMGHADAGMILRHYQHALERQKRAAIEAVPDIPMGEILGTSLGTYNEGNSTIFSCAHEIKIKQ
jgi:integrase